MKIILLFLAITTLMIMALNAIVKEAGIKERTSYDASTGRMVYLEEGV